VKEYWAKIREKEAFLDRSSEEEEKTNFELDNRVLNRLTAKEGKMLVKEFRRR
jgi:hypothetical protein